jgi:hypothetical protein
LHCAAIHPRETKRSTKAEKKRENPTNPTNQHLETSHELTPTPLYRAHNAADIKPNNNNYSTAKSNASANAAQQLSRKNTKQNPRHGGFKNNYSLRGELVQHNCWSDHSKMK